MALSLPPGGSSSPWHPRRPLCPGPSAFLSRVSGGFLCCPDQPRAASPTVLCPSFFWPLPSPLPPYTHSPPWNQSRVYRAQTWRGNSPPLDPLAASGCPSGPLLGCGPLGRGDRDSVHPHPAGPRTSFSEPSVLAALRPCGGPCLLDDSGPLGGVPVLLACPSCPVPRAPATLPMYPAHLSCGSVPCCPTSCKALPCLLRVPASRPWEAARLPCPGPTLRASRTVCTWYSGARTPRWALLHLFSPC